MACSIFSHRSSRYSNGSTERDYTPWARATCPSLYLRYVIRKWLKFGKICNSDGDEVTSSCQFPQQLPEQILLPLASMTIIYWMVGLRDSSAAYAYTALVILFVSNISAALGESKSNSVHYPDLLCCAVKLQIQMCKKHWFLYFPGYLFSAMFDKVETSSACLTPVDYMLQLTAGVFVNLR